MLTRTLFLKLDIGESKDIEYIKSVEDTLNLHLCYIIKKCLLDFSYNHLNVTHNYKQTNIDFAFDIVESSTNYILLDNIRYINHSIETNIIDIINDYHLNYNNSNTILNFNSCLINLDTFIITSCVLLKN